MNWYVTELMALNPSTGVLTKWQGPFVQAPNWSLAEEWCQENAAYLKIVGKLDSIIPCEKNSINPDWNGKIDFTLLAKN